MAEPRTPYLPQVITSTYKLPPDKRTDDEKAWDRADAWDFNQHLHGDSEAFYGPRPTAPSIPGRKGLMDLARLAREAPECARRPGVGLMKTITG